jgi:non-heme chloroperoxidase
MRIRLTAILMFISCAPNAVAQTSSGFFKTSDGVRIHYLQAGTGRPIVFIPGCTMPAWIWQKRFDEFSNKYHVIAVDPRSQGESDKPTYGHLPETRARDYKELVDHLALRQLVLVGWSMGCGELMKYVEQFGSDNIAGLVLVDGYLRNKPAPDVFTAMSGWMNQLQEDRQKQADGFVCNMFRKPQPEPYIKRLVEASMQVPADTAAVLIYNMIAVTDFNGGFTRLNRPVLFAYQPDSQATADLLTTKLADKVQLKKFDGDGHALFVDDPEKFDAVLAEFLSALPQ